MFPLNKSIFEMCDIGQLFKRLKWFKSRRKKAYCTTWSTVINGDSKEWYENKVTFTKSGNC